MVSFARFSAVALALLCIAVAVQHVSATNSTSSIDFELDYTFSLPFMVPASMLTSGLATVTVHGDPFGGALAAGLQNSIPVLGDNSDSVSVAVTSGTPVGGMTFRFKYALSSDSLADLTDVQTTLSDSSNVDLTAVQQQTALAVAATPLSGVVSVSSVANPQLSNLLEVVVATTTTVVPTTTTTLPATTTTASLPVTTTSSTEAATTSTTMADGSATIDFDLDYTFSIPFYVSVDQLVAGLATVTQPGDEFGGALQLGLKNAIAVLTPGSVVVDVTQGSLVSGSTFRFKYQLSAGSFEDLANIQTTLLDSSNVDTAAVLTQTTLAVAASNFALKSFVQITAVANPALSNLLVLPSTTTSATTVTTATTVSTASTASTATTVTTPVSIDFSLDYTFSIPFYVPQESLVAGLATVTQDGDEFGASLQLGLKNAIPALAPASVVVDVTQGSLVSGSTFRFQYQLSAGSISDLASIQTTLLDSSNVDTAAVLTKTTDAVAASDFELKSFVQITAVANPQVSNLVDIVVVQQTTTTVAPATTTSAPSPATTTTTAFNKVPATPGYGHHLDGPQATLTSTQVPVTTTTQAPVTTTQAPAPTTTTTSASDDSSSSHTKYSDDVPRLELGLDYVFQLPTNIGITAEQLLQILLVDDMGLPLIAALKEGIQESLLVGTTLGTDADVQLASAVVVESVESDSTSAPFNPFAAMAQEAAPFGMSEEAAPFPFMRRNLNEAMLSHRVRNTYSIRSSSSDINAKKEALKAVLDGVLSESSMDAAALASVKTSTLAAIQASTFMFKDYVSIDTVASPAAEGFNLAMIEEVVNTEEPETTTVEPDIVEPSSNEDLPVKTDNPAASTEAVPSRLPEQQEESSSTSSQASANSASVSSSTVAAGVEQSTTTAAQNVDVLEDKEGNGPSEIVNVTVHEKEVQFPGSLSLMVTPEVQAAILGSASFKRGLDKACLERYQRTIGSDVVGCTTDNLQFSQAQTRLSSRGSSSVLLRKSRRALQSVQTLTYSSSLVLRSATVATLDIVANAAVQEASSTEPEKLESFEQLLKESIAEEVAQADESDSITTEAFPSSAAGMSLLLQPVTAANVPTVNDIVASAAQEVTVSVAVTVTTTMPDVSANADNSDQPSALNANAQSEDAGSQSASGSSDASDAAGEKSAVIVILFVLASFSLFACMVAVPLWNSGACPRRSTNPPKSSESLGNKSFLSRGKQQKLSAVLPMENQNGRALDNDVVVDLV
jgi:hypothetical protein